MTSPTDVLLPTTAADDVRLPRRLARIEENEVLDEMVLYDPERDMAFSLNTSARSVWELCDGSRTLEAMSRTLARRLRCGDRGALLADIRKIVDEFYEMELLEA